MIRTHQYRYALWCGAVLLLVACAAVPLYTHAQTIRTATTSLYISICGDAIVNDGEQCDVPAESGAYSTTIAGRQCTALCQFGPYCGDAILQTVHGEECDDGNNTSGDFCSATCEIEPAGGGGGGSSGGGGGSSGGSSNELGDTQVSIQGRAYPNASVNILYDGSSVGNVRADSNGSFTFSEGFNPGSATFGFWSTDLNNIRSITFTTTFDIIQGAVTNLNGILIPPTLRVTPEQVDRGASVDFGGQTIPNATISVFINNDEITLTGTSDARGVYSIPFDTSRVSSDAHTAKAKFEYLSGGTRRESSFSRVETFYVGVDADSVITSADLNQDGSVNLVDFSILVFWWGTDGGNSNPPADINSNNNVGLEDFSILLFNWSG